MGEFHQHPDGLIFVRGDDGALYHDTRENFVMDAGAALPAMPDGADDHIYTQGRRNAYMGGGDVIDGGPVPWEWGDQIIANVGALLFAQRARQPQPLSEPAAPPSILSQDLMAQFTAADAARIKAAVDTNMQFWLLWSSLQAQSEPMVVTNGRFIDGWNALRQVLGEPRMAEIASNLGISVG